MKAAVSTTVGQWDYVACVAGVQPDCYSGCIKCTAKVVANHKDSELGNCVKCQKKQLDENMVSSWLAFLTTTTSSSRRPTSSMKTGSSLKFPRRSTALATPSLIVEEAILRGFVTLTWEAYQIC